MSGQIKAMLAQLIHMRVGNNPLLEAPFKIKLIMKGVDPDLFDDRSPDDPAVIQRIKTIAKSMGQEL